MMMTSLLDAGVSLTDSMKSPSVWRKIVSFYCRSVILDLDPYEPHYTLLLTKGHAFWRTYKGAGDEEEYSILMAPPLMTIPLMGNIHYLMMNKVV